NGGGTESRRGENRGIKKNGAWTFPNDRGRGKAFERWEENCPRTAVEQNRQKAKRSANWKTPPTPRICITDKGPRHHHQAEEAKTWIEIAIRQLIKRDQRDRGAGNHQRPHVNLSELRSINVYFRRAHSSTS